MNKNTMILSSKNRFWPLFNSCCPYIAILTAIVLFYFNMVTVQGAWLVGDHAEQHFPWAVYLSQSLKQGHLPFWTDLIHAGFPIAAEGQISLFYLPNLIFYFLFPIETGYAWNIIFHLLASAFLMFSLMRLIKLDNPAAFFGTFVYLFGSTLGGAYYNITSLKVLTWFPASLILIEKILGKNGFDWKKIILLGFVFSLSLLAGYLQFATYAILFSGFYMVFRSFEINGWRARKNIFAFLSMVFAVLIAAGIAWPQLQLTYELAIRSNRAFSEEGFAYVGSYNPLTLICLLFPSLEGFFISKLYLGVLPIFFMILALFYFKTQGIRTVYFLALVAFLLALGRFSPLYVGLVKLFHFHSFRTPVKFIFFSGFFLSILAAVGMQKFLADGEEQRKRRGFNIFIFCGVFSILSVIAAFFIFRFFEKPMYQLGEWVVKNFIYETPGHPYDWEHYRRKLDNFIPFAQEVLNPLRGVILTPVFKMGVSMLLVAAFLRRQFKKPIFYFFSLLILTGDLNFSYSDIRGDYESYSHFFKKDPVLSYLENHLQRNRYFNYSSNLAETPVPVSKNMIYELESVNAYSPLVLKDYYDFFSALGGVNDSTGFSAISDEFFYSHLNLLGMLNVKMIVSDRDLNHPELTRLFSSGEWHVYQNAKAMDKYFLVNRFSVEPDPKKLLQQVHATGFDPAHLAWLEQKPEKFYGLLDTTVQEVKIRLLRNRPEKKSFEVMTAQEAIFVVSQIYYPGWQVRVDGETASLYRANALLTALPLRQGKHVVELFYDPWQDVKEKVS